MPDWKEYLDKEIQQKDELLQNNRVEISNDYAVLHASIFPDFLRYPLSALFYQSKFLSQNSLPCSLISAEGKNTCPQMVTIDSGSFFHGEKSEVEPEQAGAHLVHMAAFELDAYEVTIEQWQFCVDDGACLMPREINLLARKIRLVISAGMLCRAIWYGYPEKPAFHIGFLLKPNGNLRRVQDQKPVFPGVRVSVLIMRIVVSAAVILISMRLWQSVVLFLFQVCTICPVMFLNGSLIAGIRLWMCKRFLRLGE